jgi:subtilisin family serine protease
MGSPNWKNHKKQILRFIFISFILTFPNVLNNIQNSSLGFSEDSNQLGIYSSKIDSHLLQFINSNEKNQNLPIIILYNYNDEAFKEELEENSNTPIYNYRLILATSLYMASNKIHSIAKSPAVKRICLDKKVYPLSFEKTKITQEIHESSTQKLPHAPLVNQSLSQIGVPYLWDLDLNGSGIIVAVLDTGIDETHPDLNDLDDNPTTNDPKIINEISFIDLDYNGIPDENEDDEVGHGTHVAGIISGTGEASSYKFKGVAPGSKLMNVKVLTTYGGFESWIIKGLEYAVYGGDEDPNNGNEADIISMSLGGSGFIDDPLVQAVEAAWNLNKTVVIAAGNSGDEFFTLESPGLSAKAITVGASDSFDKVADFSSRGPSPDLRMGIDIVAPGVDIISALANQSIRQQSNQNYTSKSGTSMATPFVAGSVALLLQSNPDLVPTTIKTALMATAVDLGVSSYIQGSGRIDVHAAYNLINNIQGAWKTFNRLNTTDSLDINSETIYAQIEPCFYFGFLGDWHWNESYGVAHNDLRDMFFAIRYNTSEEQRYYTSSELVQNYPYEMRWLIYNETHKIAVESLKTPDEIFKIDIQYEYYNDSRWIRVSFNITSFSSQDINNTKFYLYMRPDIERGDIHDGEYIQSLDALVANRTFYDDWINSTINNFVGFSSINKSIAFDIDLWDNVNDKLDSDTLTNKTTYRGELALAQEWLNSTITPNSHAFIPIILAFGENKTKFIDNIKEGKSIPIFKLTKPDIAINTLSISNPIYNGTKTYLNVSVINVGYTQSASFNVSTHIDNVKINHTEISGLNPGEETFISIPIIFNKTGYYDLTINAAHLKDEFKSANWNNRINRKITVMLPILATFFPRSHLDNPMNLKYGGQYIYWNCCILQGENLSDLKLNKTGMAKSFVSFDGNPSSFNSLSIMEGIGQYYVNISIEIPKGISGLFEFNLQLLNSSCILHEIPIEFEILEDLPAQLIIVNSTMEEGGLNDGDGIVEGEEMGEVSLCIKSVNASKTTNLYNPFLIVSSRNDSSIDLQTYRVLFEEYSLSANETSWNYEYYPFVFSVAYNYSNLYVRFSSIIFARVGYSSQDYIPFFHQKFNFSIQQRVPGIPDLELDSYEYLDLDMCDYDGIVEPGEVGVFGLNFRNKGDGSALQIFNTNFSCSDSRVTIPQPYYEWHFFIFIFIIPTIHIQWNGIDPGDTSEIYSGFPVFILPSSIPRGTILNFEMEIEYCNITGDNFKETFQFSYTVPGGGNGDGDGDGNGDGNGEDDMVIILLIISASSIGGIVAVVTIIIIKRRKSGFSRGMS